MNKEFLKTMGIFTVAVISLQSISCKGKGSAVTTDTTTIAPVPTDNNVTKTPDTAVIISPDDALKTQIGDATKDYPGVSATIDQGVVTLTGTITRDKLPKLMQAINALHPKKVANNLTIK